MRPAPEGLNNQDHTSLPVYGAAQNAEYLPHSLSHLPARLWPSMARRRTLSISPIPCHTSLPVYGAAQNAEYLPPIPSPG